MESGRRSGSRTPFIRIIVSFFAGIMVAFIFFTRFLRRRSVAQLTGRKLAVFFGDSITQRALGPDTSGFLAAIGDYWTRRVDVMNRGFGGYNSRWGLQMFTDVVLKMNPDFVCIFFGANDAVDPLVLQHVPLEEYKQNIRTMTSLALQRLQPGSAVLIITPPPVWEPLLSEYNKGRGKAILLDRSNQRTARYADACIEVGKELGVPVLDLFSALGGRDTTHLSSSPHTRSRYLIDGLHLNKDGHKKLFELFKDLLISSPQLSDWDPTKSTSSSRLPMHMPPWFDHK